MERMEGTLKYPALASLDLVTNGALTIALATVAGFGLSDWLTVIGPAFVMGAVGGEAAFWALTWFRWASLPEEVDPMPGMRICVLVGCAAFMALICGASMAVCVTAVLAGFGVPNLRLGFARQSLR